MKEPFLCPQGRDIKAWSDCCWYGVILSKSPTTIAVSASGIQANDGDKEIQG
jgi:hypothetical protein